MSKTLSDVMPREFRDYTTIRAYKYRNVEVVSEHNSMSDKPWIPWVGAEKHVYYWVILANGVAVGWNESPSRGWGFPCKSIKKLQRT